MRIPDCSLQDGRNDEMQDLRRAPLATAADVYCRH
jgi:hypothetical protein